MSRARCIEVPVEVRRKAAAQGARGRRWLAGLGAAVAELERAWDVVVGAALQGGSDSYVAEATTAGGHGAILKLALPGDGVSHEIEALRHADGRGYVRLLRHDLERRAMLQERLGASLAASGLPVRAQLEVICSTLRRAWVVPPEPSFLSGADKAAWLGRFIAGTWHELDRPCPERVVECAMAFAEARRRAFDPRRAVLVHGDAHASNALRALDGYRLVDPDGLFAEPACDLAVPMREYSRELLDAADTLAAARDRCEHLSRLTAVDPRAIWEWGFMERVSTGLLALRVGREELGREMLAVADELVSPWTYDVPSRPGGGIGQTPSP